ncbi:MAG: HAD-IA family hydrolase [Gammaproteobacteria bacterium]|nr:HAD-IA family hydrolase [Gammaproteobacteria bacterium]
MAAWELTGRVTSGLGQGARFTSLEWARHALIAQLGVDPHPGTLNLQLDSGPARSVWKRVRSTHGEKLTTPDGDACHAVCVPVRIGGRIPGAIVLPQVPGYDPSQVELIAAVPLRHQFDLRDGDEIDIAATDMSGVRAVVFDVDGTLVNSIEGIQIAAGRAAAMFGYRVALDAVRRALNEGESLWDLILPSQARRDPEIVSILRRETLRHWSQVLRESVHVFPGLPVSLRRLQDAGLRLAIVTGSRGESFLPLRREQVLDYFDPIVTADQVGRPKPHPDGLLLCLEKLGCAASEAVYVGDTSDDMRAGRAAGMRTIGVLTGAADGASLSIAGADRLVSDHAALLRALIGFS